MPFYLVSIHCARYKINTREQMSATPFRLEIFKALSNSLLAQVQCCI